MKKCIIYAILAVILFNGCTLNQENSSTETIEIEIAQLLDKYLEAWNTKDIKTLDLLTSDNGMYFGSDPDELMDKTALIAMYREFFTDTTGDYRYELNFQKIIPAHDGESVMAVEYITFKNWSPKIPLRQSFQFVKKDKGWIIDFIAWGLIIKNEDVERLNKVLE